MIIMNSRTQDMFDNDAQYPFLTMDTWKNQPPNFTDPKDLFTTQLDVINTYVLDQANEKLGVVLPIWRLISTGPESFVHPDWPIPVDLSYSDADLQTAGLGRFPLGDLNWFPAQKDAWLAQRSAEYDSIDYSLSTGRMVTAVKEHNKLPVQFKLHQNYPNPFNPVTIISWQLAVSSHVNLSIYNILGQKVVTLVDKKQSAGHHQIKWDASGLASGIYLYHLKVNEHEISKKMVLMK